MAKINPRDVFVNADSFFVVCALLNKEVRAGSGLILTHVIGTNAAFALELYLKTLILDETTIYRSTHDLWKLFNHLRPGTRSLLEREHADYVQARPEFAREAAMKNYPTELKELLVRGRNTFVDFRYMHERFVSIKPRSTLFGLNHFTFVVRERILKAHPEWRSWPDEV